MSLLVIKFRIGGLLRYLSHAETLRLFERACVRAGINLQYSQGFNPHPRLSLPLPRPVGVDSDDELLTLKVHWELNPGAEQLKEQSIKDALSAQLPEGCRGKNQGVISNTQLDGIRG